LTGLLTAAGSAGRDTTPMLELREISKRFGTVRANDMVSLQVYRGEILGILGENGAGKSTLMNIVYGLQQPDSGQILIDGEPVRLRSPQDAVKLRIGMVHQHFMLVSDMTAVENVALAPSSTPAPSRLAAVRKKLEEISSRFRLAVDLDANVDTMSVGARQRVEILKVLYRGADLLILDEPSSALTPQEWDRFGEFLHAMVAEGKAVVLITHKLDELFGIANRCIVLRDGKVVHDVQIADTDKPSLALKMVGREVKLVADRVEASRGKLALRVDRLNYARSGSRALRDITFDICEGEVFGVAGVAGNGQSELVDVLVGLRQATGGLVEIDGRALNAHSAREFTKSGGALIPEDRQADGIASELSVLDNLMVKELSDPPYSRRGIVDWEAARRHSKSIMSDYEVRAPGAGAPIGQLSGGNQQKVVLARELSRRPRLIIAFQPTLGLDVGATENVYRRLGECKQAGAAILLVSYELDEVLSFADRFAVMVDGRFLRTLDAGEANLETIGLLIAGEAA
jgi:ABC-type uncharacterized transport system ATPase subunit